LFVPMTTLAAPGLQLLRRPRLSAWAAASLGLCIVYTVIFVITEDMSLATAFLVAFGNVAPLILLAAAVRSLLLTKVLPLPLLLQTAWQVILSISFALCWYASSRLGVALVSTVLGDPFRVTGFKGPALAWQLFQGLMLYAALAAITFAQWSPAAFRKVEARDADARWLERYLIRSGEDFHPIDVSQIVTISGAQDYSEVTTPSSRHLVRLSLAEFESKLDPHRFIRVHRSKIIHLAHLERAELAGGGRMLAHMSNGDSVPVSRAGVKSLRTLIV